MPDLGLTTVLFFASAAIQVVQANRARDAQRRAQEEAEARADAAKGFQMVSSGAPAAIPVVYGRAKVGGSRVYHRTFSNYVFPADSDTTAVTLGGRVFKGNNPVILRPPAAGKVRVYFIAPAGTNVKKILNTIGINSLPVIESMPAVVSERSGNHDMSSNFSKESVSSSGMGPNATVGVDSIGVSEGVVA